MKGGWGGGGGAWGTLLLWKTLLLHHKENPVPETNIQYYSYTELNIIHICFILDFFCGGI